MPLKNFDTLTFPDLILLRGTFVEPGTLPWLLSEHHRLLLPELLFKGWKGERKVGREAWPAPRLMAMLLLRRSEAGMTRLPFLTSRCAGSSIPRQGRQTSSSGIEYAIDVSILDVLAQHWYLG